MTLLDKLCAQADQFGYRQICDVVLKDVRFPKWSGASHAGTHHYGDGGLIKHVSEVVDLCLDNNKYFSAQEKNVDVGHLFLAALFHDAGKMWDYERIGVGEWRAAEHKYKIHHICRSALVWQDAYTRFPYGLKQEHFDEILHAILAHHGRREWGSPVEPQTRLAWLLHLCDGLSARMDDCKKGNK
jgi:3'-5' exoribonuclease